MVKHASIWFDGVQNQRVREGKGKVNIWAMLLKQLGREFVPTTYLNQMYSKWSSLEQGTKSVGEILKEFERLTIVCDINERLHLKLSRFFNGLNVDLKDKVEAQPYVSFEEACKLAITLKSQRKKRVSSNPCSFRIPTPTTGPVRNTPYTSMANSSSRPTPSPSCNVAKGKEPTKHSKEEIIDICWPEEEDIVNE